MFLQATVDAPSYDAAEWELRRYQGVEAIDYIEIGAPMVTHYGVEALTLFCKYAPVWRLYADLKIIDFPVMELTPWLEHGIRRTSAMAVMNDGAFRQLADLRDKAGLSVLVSLMGYPAAEIPKRVHALSELGFYEFIAHGAGVTTDDAFADMVRMIVQLRSLQLEIPGLKIVAAGGINISNVSALYPGDYHGLIVGRGLFGAPDVKRAAHTIRRTIIPTPQPGEAAYSERA